MIAPCNLCVYFNPRLREENGTCDWCLKHLMSVSLARSREMYCGEHGRDFVARDSE